MTLTPSSAVLPHPPYCRIFRRHKTSLKTNCSRIFEEDFISKCHPRMFGWSIQPAASTRELVVYPG
jgi:hypothetical protein